MALDVELEAEITEDGASSGGSSYSEAGIERGMGVDLAVANAPSASDGKETEALSTTSSSSSCNKSGTNGARADPPLVVAVVENTGLSPYGSNGTLMSSREGRTMVVVSLSSSSNSRLGLKGMGSLDDELLLFRMILPWLLVELLSCDGAVRCVRKIALGGVPGGSSSSLDAIRRLLK